VSARKAAKVAPKPEPPIELIATATLRYVNRKGMIRSYPYDIEGLIPVLQQWWGVKGKAGVGRWQDVPVADA
jgi:hypothetical protein